MALTIEQKKLLAEKLRIEILWDVDKIEFSQVQTDTKECIKPYLFDWLENDDRMYHLKHLWSCLGNRKLCSFYEYLSDTFGGGDPISQLFNNTEKILIFLAEN